MIKPSQKLLKKSLKEKGINVKELFPRSKIQGNRNFTPYQLKKIAKAYPEIYSGAPQKKQEKNVIYPDMPKHYAAAGFERRGKKIITSSDKIKIVETYKHEGASSFYKAVFFGGVVNVQLIPIMKLPEFLEYQIQVDDDEGQFYDKITLREGDRDMHGFSKGFNSMADSAEELYLYLIEYKRHGALIGEGGTFEYIQVCFINFN